MPNPNYFKKKDAKGRMPKENSMATYLKVAIQTMKEAGTEDLDKVLKFVMDSDKKTRTKHNKLNAIISVAKHSPDTIDGDITAIKKARDKLQKEINDSVNDNNLNERQSAVLDKVTMKDIYDLKDKLESDKDKSGRDLENYVLLSLMIPPLRNDLQDVKISRGDKPPKGKINTIHVPSSGEVTLSIKDHKTTSRGGKPIVRTLDNALSDDIRQLVSDKRSHLFINKNGLPLSDSAFSHRFGDMMKKYTGHNITSTILRKIYLSDKYGDVKKKASEMKKDAQDMGHSVETQQKYYVAD